MSFLRSWIEFVIIQKQFPKNDQDTMENSLIHISMDQLKMDWLCDSQIRWRTFNLKKSS